MQMAFFAWLSRYPEIDKLTWHTPNQGRSAQEGAKLKLMGVKAGVPDIFVAIPFKLIDDESSPFLLGQHKGLFLELKSENGKLSPSQEAMFQNLKEQGYFCCTANTLESAKTIIRNCYGGLMNEL